MKQTTDKAIARGFRVLIGIWRSFNWRRSMGRCGWKDWKRRSALRPGEDPRAVDFGDCRDSAATPHAISWPKWMSSGHWASPRRLQQRLVSPYSRPQKSRRRPALQKACSMAGCRCLRQLAAGDPIRLAKLDAWEPTPRTRLADATATSRPVNRTSVGRNRQSADPEATRRGRPWNSFQTSGGDAPARRPTAAAPAPPGRSTAVAAIDRLGRIPPAARGSAILTFLRLLVLLMATWWFRRFINRRLRKEKLLRDSESFARATVDALPTHIAILDGGGEMLSTNRAWHDFAAALRTTARGSSAQDSAATRSRSNYLAVCDGLAGKHVPDAAHLPPASVPWRPGSRTSSASNTSGSHRRAAQRRARRTSAWSARRDWAETR